jgi:succinate dehydrogenase / fumarate reductase membrane anchor subunit
MAVVKKLIIDMSLTGNGLRDWLVQRFSSLIIAAYFIILSIFFFMHKNLNYDILHNLFSSTWMQVFTFITLISLFLHAWVGVWTIITDYAKPIFLRLALQLVVILTLTIYFIWGVVILWESA